MGYLGLEPRTYRLKAEYSTIELVTQHSLIQFDSMNQIESTRIKELTTFPLIHEKVVM